MRRAVTFAALLLLPVVAAASTERYVVALKAGFPAAGARALIRDVEASPDTSRHVATFDAVEAFAADLTAAEVAALRRSPNVRYAERVVERHILGTPGRAAADAFRNLDGQTVPAGIDIVRARDVWGVTHGEAVNVVVIDTGVDYTHPDLSHAWKGGFNALNSSTDAKDNNDHGTHVAGTIAAADNEVGVVGVAPKILLWGAKVLNANGTGTTDHVVAGIDWAITQKRTLGGNWVMNLSLGSSVDSVAEREAIARAVAEGILVVAATGNDSTSTLPAAVGYPAAYPGVLAVGAVDPQLRLATFSNQGPEVGVVGPGVDVLSSVRVGAGSLTGVLSEAVNYPAAALVGSAKGAVTGSFVYCGLGKPEDFPPSVKGRIALIRRGEITFALKTRRAKEAGAIAVVIANNNTDPLAFTLFDLNDPTTELYEWPVTIAVSQADGDRLLARTDTMVTIANRADDYETKNGTSMASPHAAAVAALVWSVAPTATAAEVRNALIMTARDLGSAGFDSQFGHGVVNALEAAKMMNPAAFGAPSKPADDAPSGRRTLRRRGRP